MGNFSRDTFKLTNTMYQLISGEEVKDPKHYVGVRLQQGVPLVDADWNELEDIRKYEQRAFLKWVVGNGVPQANDGFCIKNPGLNDFTINSGVCYVDGWEVINIADTQYTKQALYNNDKLADNWGVERLSPIKMDPSSLYTVYLDVWQREVGNKEDGRMVNDAIGIETCVRLKREWVVRVAQGKMPVEKPGHAYYKLAAIQVKHVPHGLVTETDPGTLHDAANISPFRNFKVTALGTLNDPINNKPLDAFITVTDFRRTGLAILSEEITIKDGNVGIGITNPTAKLSVGTTALPGTAHSTTFKTNAGSLGTKADDELALASMGFLSKNASAFGIRAYRTKAGDDWTTTAIGFGMDVDNTVRATASGFKGALWLDANGHVGVGHHSPRESLDVNGRIICKNTRKQVVKTDTRAYANNGNWEVVPDMHTTVTVGQNSMLIIFMAGIKFKGEVLFSLYVDNQPKANTRIKSDNEEKTDVTLTALAIDQNPGNHDIRVEWLPSTGSTATISDLQMTRQLLVIEL